MTEYIKEMAKSYAVGSQRFYELLGSIVEVAKQGQELISETEKAGQGVLKAAENIESTIKKILVK
jgi:hypothetical protein